MFSSLWWSAHIAVRTEAEACHGPGRGLLTQHSISSMHFVNKGLGFPACWMCTQSSLNLTHFAENNIRGTSCMQGTSFIHNSLFPLPFPCCLNILFTAFHINLYDVYYWKPNLPYKNLLWLIDSLAAGWFWSLICLVRCAEGAEETNLDHFQHTQWITHRWSHTWECKPSSSVYTVLSSESQFLWTQH